MGIADRTVKDFSDSSLACPFPPMASTLTSPLFPCARSSGLLEILLVMELPGAECSSKRGPLADVLP